MNFPKEILSWKSGNLGLTILGVWLAVLAFMSPNRGGVPGINTVANEGIFAMGIMFLSVALINAKSRPTVLGSLFTMMIGLCYFMGFVSNMNIAILWTLSLGLFALVLVFELDIFKFGPSSNKAKLLTVVPLAIVGFTLLLGFFGYGPLTFNWTYWMTAVYQFAIMVFCWLYVWDYVASSHRKLLGMSMNNWLNILPLLAVALSLLSVGQGTILPLSWATLRALL